MNLDEFLVGEPVYLGITYINVEVPTGTTTQIYTQSIPLATWTISHSFGRLPQVTIINSNNLVVFTDIEYPNNTTVILTFSTPMTGKAILQ